MRGLKLPQRTPEMPDEWWVHIPAVRLAIVLEELDIPHVRIEQDGPLLIIADPFGELQTYKEEILPRLYGLSMSGPGFMTALTVWLVYPEEVTFVEDMRL